MIYKIFSNVVVFLGLMFAISVFIWAFFMFSVVSHAHATPEEPPLSELHQWYPIQDGTVILEYRIINKNSVQIWQFKHAQKGVAVKIPSCNEAAIHGDEIRLVTQEPKPTLYFIEKKSNGFFPKFHLDFTYDKW